MEREPVKSFNAALVSFHESREAPSKAKIEELSKAALKAKMHYKFIVFSIEKFLPKCKIERRLHVLYLIDSIVRASKRRFKENDVYGKRFLEKLSSCLPYLLQCKQKERLRVIRTLNLWQSNSIFTEEELKPFRERCRDDGLIIDFEEVEKAVKGGKADMKIYGGGYIKKDKPAKAVKSTTPTMPPPPDDGLLGAGPGLMPHIPDLPAFPLSEDRINGTINEREMLELIQRFHIDKATLFSKDREMLHNALHFFVARLVQKVDAANSERDQERNRRATNIKNVLTKDFEYSDDEDEDRDKKASEEDPDEIKNLNHDEIFAIAVNLMETNDEINLGIVHIVNSRINAITTASKIIREQIASSAPAPMMQQPPPNQTMTGLQQPQQQLGLPGMPGLTPQQQLNAFQNIHPALLQNQAQLLMQQGRLPQLNPQNLLVLGNPLLQGFPPGLGLGIPNGPPPNAQPNGAQQQLDLVKLGMGHLGIPGVPGVPPNMIPPELQAVLNQQKMLAEMAENKGAIEESDGRGRDRESRVNRNKDRDRSRERRKMGIPSTKPNITYIASRTLWLKKVPPNVTENELKEAVESCGETSRIKIISNRACAFITMQTRKSANEVVTRLREVTVAKKQVKVYWARGPGMDDQPFSTMWQSDRGVLAVPFDQLPTDLTKLCEGAVLDIDSLPDDKANMYKENGEVVVAPPPALPSVPQFSFPGIQSHINQDILNLVTGRPPVPAPPGFGQMNIPPQMKTGPPQALIGLNMAAPPPPGIPNFSTAPPPPGVQHRGVPPPSFDPNKPPPMTGMGLNMPPAVPFGTPNTFRGGFRGGRGGFDGGRGGFDGGRGGFDGGRRMEGGRGPVPQPGTSNGFDISRRGGFEGGRGGFRNEGRRYNDESRGSGDRNDDRRDRDRERFNDRQTDRRRVEDDNNSRRRVSRWNDSDRRDDNRRRSGEGEREREREPRRRERSRSVERRQRRSPSYSNGDEKAAINEQTQQEQRSSVDDEIVSSTTFDEVKPATVTEVKTEDQITEPKASVDQTDEVPMDLE